MSPRIVECELTFIDRTPIDFPLAARQHEEYRAALKRHSATVEELSGNESYPDSCFVEDTAIVVDEVAVITSMGAVSRRGETALIERALSRYRDIVRVSLPATIEGGDVLRVGKKIYVGQSSRTNALGVEELAKVLNPLGYEVIPVETKRSLHLKSACTAIDDETLIVNPGWVELDSFRGFNLLRTPAEEPWSANVLRVGPTVFLQAGFPRTLEMVQRVTEKVEVVDTSELGKAEGALTCLSIIFESAI
ncbi:MAG: dimethylarginine dimethylaminohydrolase family protein [Blastocatellia bacterium]